MRLLRALTTLRTLRWGLAGMSVASGLSLAAAHAQGLPPIGAAGAPQHPLAFKPDTYNGVIIDSGALAGKSAPEFGEALRTACSMWREEGKRGVWLHLPLLLSELIPVAVSQGFSYHHADNEVLTLIRWLPDTPSSIPPGPSHQIGVGAFVQNGRREVLMVKERSGPAAKYNIWKVPTGLIERREDLVEACRREVLEETGVQTMPDGARIMSFRCVPSGSNRGSLPDPSRSAPPPLLLHASRLAPCSLS
jgi:hypothetical protein